MSEHIGILGRMLRHMRTTVILPDELFRQVKERVRAEDRTFTSFLEDAIRHELARRDDASVGAVDVYLAPPYRGQEGARSGIDLTSNASILDAMDEGVPIEKLR